MKENMMKKEENNGFLEELDFNQVEQLEEIASPGFIGTIFCGC